MKKLLFVSLLLISIQVSAQQPVDTVKTVTASEQNVKKDTRPFIRRISLGGSTGFWINTRQTHVEVSPLLAYHFPKILTTGFGYRYIYTRDRFYGKNLNTYGPNIFARASLTKRIYLWSEWENMRTEYALELGNQDITTQKENVQSAFAGAGYIRQLGKRGRGGISVQLLYNFLYDHEDHSPYYSPVIYRVGYFF
jgi:hypothetical protein